MNYRDVFVSREELYEKVWAIPTQRLAQGYGISDVALAKICSKLGVPKPPRGYWARKKAGQELKIPPIPIKGAKQPAGVYLSRKSEPKPVVQLSQSTLEIIEHLMTPQNMLAVSDSLSKTHRLVRRTKQAFLRAKSDKYGALWWNEGCLNIRVSKRSLTRALLIMDALLKQLEKLDYEITVPDSGETLVHKDGVKMGIVLYERSRRIEETLTEKQKLHPWRYEKYRFDPTCEFEFTLRRWPLAERHWKDSAKRKLEHRLTDIVVGIVRSTELVRLENKKREAERLQRLERKRLEAERIEREMEENRRREELEKQASCWRRASDLRSFLQACEMEFSKRSKPIGTVSQEARWLAWAYEHANRIDPCVNGSLSDGL